MPYLDRSQALDIQKITNKPGRGHSSARNGDNRIKIKIGTHDH
jgi:hypothetical protein